MLHDPRARYGLSAPLPHRRGFDRALIGLTFLSLGFLLLVPRYIEADLFSLRLNAHRLITLALLGGLLCNLGGNLRLIARASALSLLIAAYFLWALAASWLGGHGMWLGSEAGARAQLLWLDDMLACGALYLVAARAGLTDLRHLLRWLATLATWAAIYAITEYALAYNPLSRLADPQTALGHFASLDYYRGGLYRAKAGFEQPLVLALVLVTLLPLMMLQRPPARWLGSAVILAAIWATQSRMGLVLGGLAVALPLLMQPAQGRLRLAALPLTLVAVGLAAGPLRDLALGQNPQEIASSATRWDQLRIGLTLLSENGIFGFGYGNASAALLAQRSLDITLHARSIDNLYLSTALDSGLPALALFGAVILRGFACAKRAARDPLLRRFALACGTALLCAALYYLTLSIRSALPLLFFLIGAAENLARSARRRGAR